VRLALLEQKAMSQKASTNMTHLTLVLELKKYSRKEGSITRNLLNDLDAKK